MSLEQCSQGGPVMSLEQCARQHEQSAERLRGEARRRSYPYVDDVLWGLAEGEAARAAGIREAMAKATPHPAPSGSRYPPTQERRTVTFQARFKIEDISDGPAPIGVIAVAEVEDGSLTQNTEAARSMRLEIQLDTDHTSLKVGDEITASGHFIGCTEGH